MPIDDEQVRRVARLARLKLDDAEVAAYREQLGRILDYVTQLEQVDVSAVEPLAHPLPQRDVTRPDAPRQGLDTDAALANAPQREASFFRVPRVLDGSSGA